MSIKVYGASDDLIEVEGDLREEFGAPYDDNAYLGFSNGVLMRIRYTDEGVWEIRVLRGNDLVTVTPNEGEDSDRYSDVAVMETAAWVVCGASIATSGGHDD